MNAKKRSAGTLRDITNISSENRSKIRKVTTVTTTRPSYVRPFWTDDSKAKTFSSYLPQLKANNNAERFAFQYINISDGIKIGSAKKKDRVINKLKDKKGHKVRDDEEEVKVKKNKKNKKKKKPQDPTSGLWFLRQGYVHSDRSKDKME
jgi:hypothetical protein